MHLSDRSHFSSTCSLWFTFVGQVSLPFELRTFFHLLFILIYGILSMLCAEVFIWSSVAVCQVVFTRQWMNGWMPYIRQFLVLVNSSDKWQLEPMAWCGMCRYVASDDNYSLVPRILLNTDTESLDFVTSSGHQSSRRMTSSTRYEKHDIIADVGGPVKPVIPTPLWVWRREPPGWVDIGVQWTVTTQPQLIHIARLLAGELRHNSLPCA